MPDLTEGALRDAIEKVISLTLSPRGGATVLAPVLLEALGFALVEFEADLQRSGNDPYGRARAAFLARLTGGPDA